MKIELENKQICKKCGGRCCKKSGCDYIPSDFEQLSFEYLYNKLLEGKISIVSALKIETLPNGNLYANPFLFLRARNTNRPIVDLFSLKTVCSQLGENGCNYSIEERPTGGVNLIPQKHGKCYSLKDPKELMYSWESYQKILNRLVKRINGVSADEQLKLDAEKLFYDLHYNNIEGVSATELTEVKESLPMLVRLFPEQVIKVLEDDKKAFTKIKR